MNRRYQLICDGELVLEGDDTLAVVFNNMSGANFIGRHKDYANYMLTNGLGFRAQNSVMVLMGNGPVATGKIGSCIRVTQDDLLLHEECAPRNDLTWPEVRFARVGAVKSLEAAIEFVLANLPPDIELASKCKVERYPRNVSWPVGAASIGGVLAYQFMSTQGRNIATWMPDVASASRGPAMSPGRDGWGRHYDPSLCSESTEIGQLINVLQARAFLQQYPDPSATLSAVYDQDNELQSSLCTAFPGFEYPDFAHKTIAQIVKRLPDPLVLKPMYEQAGVEHEPEQPPAP